MKISLHPHHQKHVQNIGIPEPPSELEVSAEEYEGAMKMWESTGFRGEDLRTKVAGHLAWKHHHKPKPVTPKQPRNWERWYLLIIGILLIIVLLSVPAHCQFSKIKTITVTDGSTSIFTAAPFQIMFSGCAVGGTGSSMTVTCSGAAANPGGSAHQLQVNSAGTAFAGIANGTAGQVLCSNGSTLDPAMCDPIVSGPDAAGVAPTKNPVQIGLFDGTNVQRVLGSSAGRLSIDVNSAPTTAVTGTFWQATQPVSAASLPLPTGAAADSSLTTLDTDVKANITLHAGTSVIGHVIADSGSTTAVTGNVAVTKADGSDVTLGAKADAKSTATDTTAITAMQVLKEISAMEQAPASRAVTGTFWQATQPISAASLPLPIGAAADSSLTTLDTDLKADPCGDGHAKSYAFYDAATNGATQLVGLVNAKIIYVCAYYVSSSSTTANTIKLVYGTGSNCVTGQTAITPGRIVEAGTSVGPAGFTIANSAGLATIASNELCVLTNAAQAAQVEVSYVQQ